MHHLAKDYAECMKKQYQQLTLEERERILEYRWQKLSIREIGRRLDRDHTTIGREIKRNGGQLLAKYSPRLADLRARSRIKERGARPRLKNDPIRNYVLKKLRRFWSPEQIAGRWNKFHPHLSISPEAIYQFIYSRVNDYGFCRGPDLRIYLRRKHKRRNRKNPMYQRRRQMIPNRIGIERRPKYIEKRKQIGHWEGDCLVSRKSRVALQSLVERRSGLLRLAKLERLASYDMAREVIIQLGSLPPSLRRTLTMDNGLENAKHEKIRDEIGILCYFCNPYHSWEKGTNENTNGLIRRYLPKGTDFDKVSNDTITYIENELNNRPRKRLGYKTPLEVFDKESGALEY